jgi:glycerol-3-phosphate dehydrogenase (NAD(P)+)
MVFVCPGAQVDEPWKLPAGDTERGNGRSCDNWIMTNHMAATVVGGGAWGTALAKLLAGQGIPTMLWALEPEVVEAITSLRQNPVFLPGVRLPDALAVTGDLDVALAAADVVISAVPTQHMRSVFAGHAIALQEARVVVSVSKGIEVDTLRTPTEILAEITPGPLAAVALSGPSFAMEVAADHPTAVVAASRSAGNARLVRDLFSTNAFRVYSSEDVVSVELGGALKNVIAIAAGISAGLGFGRNTVAALITRGLAEITRLGVARGGDPFTFAGLAGIGDLVLTCTGDLSRNRMVGFEIGRGRKLSDIVAETETVAEGVKTTVAARTLAAELGVEMPITEQVYLTLYEDKDARRAVLELMGRGLRDERDRSTGRPEKAGT